jgi:hypothetical protein
VQGQGLFHDTNGNNRQDSLDELIGVIQSSSTLSATNTIHTAQFI